VYEAFVAMGATGDPPQLTPHAAEMREHYQKRTGAFGAEDPWFEARSRAFWDDALTTGFTDLMPDPEDLTEQVRTIAMRMKRAHRGFFVVDHDAAEAEDGSCLVDLWSGAVLLVAHLDEAQAVDLEHAEGPIDARVMGLPETTSLFVLPGAYHHSAEAREPATAVLEAARERGLGSQAVLDALMRMDLVLRSSSRVKPTFAYRIESLPR
jgi:hypothetical protein